MQQEVVQCQCDHGSLLHAAGGGSVSVGPQVFAACSRRWFSVSVTTGLCCMQQEVVQCQCDHRSLLHAAGGGSVSV